MGPISGLSSMIETVNLQIGETLTATDRLRSANRHLTGSDGRAPTPLNSAQNEIPVKPQSPEMQPLMVQLTIALNRLTEAQSDLRDEIIYLEQHSETGAPVDVKQSSTYGASRA